MHPTIAQHIEAFRQQQRVSAGSVIASMFGDAILPRGGRIWLGSLIALLAPLDINERLVRTSVFRLAKDEWLAKEATGRRADYLLTPAGCRRFEQASEHIYASNTPLWDRRWRLILAVGELDAKTRDGLRRALFWQGFGLLAPNCFIHPSVDLAEAFDALATEGFQAQLRQLMPLQAAGTGFADSVSEVELVQAAWDLDELGQAYQDFLARYQPLLEALRHWAAPQADEEAAFLMRTLLIHDYRKLLLRDPDLPDVLLPQGWPGHKARTLCKALYRRLLAPSERHLDRIMRTANGDTPQALPSLLRRFQADDPLAP